MVHCSIGLQLQHKSAKFMVGLRAADKVTRYGSGGKGVKKKRVVNVPISLEGNSDRKDLESLG